MKKKLDQIIEKNNSAEIKKFENGVCKSSKKEIIIASTLSAFVFVASLTLILVFAIPAPNTTSTTTTNFASTLITTTTIVEATSTTTIITATTSTTTTMTETTKTSMTITTSTTATKTTITSTTTTHTAATTTTTTSTSTTTTSSTTTSIATTTNPPSFLVPYNSSSLSSIFNSSNAFGSIQSVAVGIINNVSYNLVLEHMIGVYFFDTNWQYVSLLNIVPNTFFMIVVNMHFTLPWQVLLMVSFRLLLRLQELFTPQVDR